MINLRDFICRGRRPRRPASWFLPAGRRGRRPLHDYRPIYRINPSFIRRTHVIHYKFLLHFLLIKFLLSTA